MHKKKRSGLAEMTTKTGGGAQENRLRSWRKTKQTETKGGNPVRMRKIPRETGSRTGREKEAGPGDRGRRAVNFVNRGRRKRAAGRKNGNFRNGQKNWGRAAGSGKRGVDRRGRGEPGRIRGLLLKIAKKERLSFTYPIVDGFPVQVIYCT